MSTSPARDGVGGTEATSVEGLTALLALTGRPAQPRYVIIPILQVKKWSLGKVKELTEVTQLVELGLKLGSPTSEPQLCWKGTPVERREGGAL